MRITIVYWWVFRIRHKHEHKELPEFSLKPQTNTVFQPIKPGNSKNYLNGTTGSYENRQLRHEVSTSKSLINRCEAPFSQIDVSLLLQSSVTITVLLVGIKNQLNVLFLHYHSSSPFLIRGTLWIMTAVLFHCISCTLVQIENVEPKLLCFFFWSLVFPKAGTVPASRSAL